jgi:hypothetical protein
LKAEVETESYANTEDIQSDNVALMSESDEIAERCTSARKKRKPFEFKIREDLVIKTILRQFRRFFLRDFKATSKYQLSRSGGLEVYLQKLDQYTAKICSECGNE